MNLRWLKITLRVAAAILFVVAAVKLASGGLSLHTQEQATSSGVVIDHVVEFGHSGVIMTVVAFLFSR